MNRKQFIFTLLLALLSGLMGGVLSTWFLMPQLVPAQGSPQKVITAEQFQLVDKHGKVRGEFGVRDYAAALQAATDIELKFTGDMLVPGLRLFSEDGQRTLAQLSLEGDSPFLRIIDDTDATTLLGAERLALFDSDENLRAALGATNLKHTDTGSTEIRAPSSLVLFDEEGNVVWSAP